MLLREWQWLHHPQGYACVGTQGGSDFFLTIQESINRCEVFVAVCSSTYSNKEESEWTYMEYTLAKTKKKHILPVFHSGTWPPAGIEMYLITKEYVPKDDGSLSPVWRSRKWLQRCCFRWPIGTSIPCKEQRVAPWCRCAPCLQVHVQVLIA